jgi:hypothetical protein
MIDPPTVLDDASCRSCLVDTREDQKAACVLGSGAIVELQKADSEKNRAL